MSLSDILIVASIITGLTSVPFVASSITSDYGPTGNIILDMDNSSSVPSKLSRSLTSEKFEQTYETPFGELHVLMESDRVYQELSRPDRRTVVEQTPEKTEWKLISQDYTLTVTRTGEKVVDKFTSPDGYLEKVKKMGNTEEIVRGDVEGEYQEAKELLDQDLEKINEIMEEHMNIPGEVETYSVVVNEVLPDPNETQNYNGSNETVNDDEFIEIYNHGDSDLDVSNWTLEDETGNELKIPEGKTLESGDLMTFLKSEDSWEDWGGSWPTLNNDGDKIILRDENGNVVDSFEYDDSTDGLSWSRIGEGNYQEEEPTPDEYN